MDIAFYQKLLKKELTALFNGYDFIIVVSEASKLRHFVSTLDNPQKIQWIHTDYVAWRNHNNWTKKITANDKKTYKNFDVIVCLSEHLCDKFSAYYPNLAKKAVAIPNLIDYGSIMEKSKLPSAFEVDKSKLNIITIGRMEEEKCYDRILHVAKDLKDKGVDFVWYLVGDGNLLKAHKKLCCELDLCEKVIFTGYLENVSPLLKQCDLFVMMSEYEGTPVTIDEAKVLGVPVLAKDVGGIRDQVKNGFGKALSSISANDITKLECSMKEQDFAVYNTEIIDNLKSLLK